MMDLSNSEICSLIDEYIHSKRDRSIMKLRLIDGMLYQQIADLYELSDRQIKNIVYKNEEKIFKNAFKAKRKLL